MTFINRVRNFHYAEGGGGVSSVKLVKPLTVSALRSPFSMAELKGINEKLEIENCSNSSVFKRPKCSLGTPGALLKFESSVPVVLIGDLHGNAPRLDRILQVYGERLSKGEITLLFLGDLIHAEDDDKVEYMEGSFDVLNSVIKLKFMYPENIHLLLGNHDYLTESLTGFKAIKNFVDQSAELVSYIAGFYSTYYTTLNQAGYYSKPGDKDLIVHEYQRFLDGCALAAIIKGKNGAVLCAHSAVVMGGVTEEELVNAKQNSVLAGQLMWNRPKKPNDPSGFTDSYAKDDVSMVVNKMGYGPDLYIVSGHNLPPPGKSYYYPFPGKKHIILHANQHGAFNVLIIREGRVMASDLLTSEIVKHA